MSYNYAPLQASASAMIQKFGREYTFTRTTKGAYSASTGTTADTSTTYTKYACVFDLSEQDSGGFIVVAGDRRMLAEGHAYEVGDTVSLDAETYRIVAVSQTRPAGTTLAVNLQLRK